MTANNEQIGGDHYKIRGYQPWDFFLDANLGSGLVASAIEYTARWRQKNGIEDLKKARHFCKKLSENESRINVDINQEALDNFAIQFYKEDAQIIKLVYEGYYLCAMCDIDELIKKTEELAPAVNHAMVETGIDEQYKHVVMQMIGAGYALTETPA